MMAGRYGDLPHFGAFQRCQPGVPASPGDGVMQRVWRSRYDALCCTSRNHLL